MQGNFHLVEGRGVQQGVVPDAAQGAGTADLYREGGDPDVFDRKSAVGERFWGIDAGEGNSNRIVGVGKWEGKGPGPLLHQFAVLSIHHLQLSQRKGHGLVLEVFVGIQRQAKGKGVIPLGKQLDIIAQSGLFQIHMACPKPKIGFLLPGSGSRDHILRVQGGGKQKINHMTIPHGAIQRDGDIPCAAALSDGIAGDTQVGELLLGYIRKEIGKGLRRGEGVGRDYRNSSQGQHYGGSYRPKPCVPTFFP